MPRKIRELIADLEKAGWFPIGGGKGSHRKFAHPDSSRKIILSGASGGDAHRYQEKAVKAAIREVRK
jgi:predicted RNA binding protein YcfA (HicA-like mRNA interferase family)